MPKLTLPHMLIALVAMAAPLSGARAGEMDGSTSLILSTCGLEGWQMALTKTPAGTVKVELSPTMPEVQARCVYQQIANHDLILDRPPPYQLLPHDDTGAVPAVQTAPPVNTDNAQPR